MGSSDETAVQEPLMQPRLVRLLKNRNRVVDFGLREEFLDEMESIMVQRRAPDKVAERATSEALNRAKDAASRPINQRLTDRMEKINKSALQKL